MELQHDPARRLERRQVRQDRSRLGGKIFVAVTSRGGSLSVLDKMGLTVSAVVCADPLDVYGYAPATYGGMIIIAGGVSQGQRVAVPTGFLLGIMPVRRSWATVSSSAEARVDQCSLHTQLVTETTSLPSGRCQSSAVVQNGHL